MISGDEWKAPPPPRRTDLSARRQTWIDWKFTPGTCFRISEADYRKRKRSAPVLRPNWVRLYDGAAAQHPAIPRDLWIRCRNVTAQGFWLDTTGRVEFVRDNEVADIRVADPPEAARFEGPDDGSGSWDDDLGESTT